MKSAYELAMERLEKQAPSRTLTAAQKTEIADLEAAGMVSTVPRSDSAWV